MTALAARRITHTVPAARPVCVTSSAPSTFRARRAARAQHLHETALYVRMLDRN